MVGCLTQCVIPTLEGTATHKTCGTITRQGHSLCGGGGTCSVAEAEVGRSVWLALRMAGGAPRDALCHIDESRPSLVAFVHMGEGGCVR